jgi:ABC-type branched-subunit amino acid transport system substrate-binding protein
MATKAGIWIDHRQAVVVLATDAGKTIKRIASDIPSPDHKKTDHKYSKNDFVAEDKRQHKTMNHLTTFYNEVIASVRDAEALLIVGPGEAKGEFIKCLKSKKLRGRIVELETTDKLTDRQLAAKVDLHFAKTTANKTATPKATAKKTTKASSAKRTSKSNR